MNPVNFENRAEQSVKKRKHSLPGGKIYFSWFNFVATCVGGAALYVAYLYIKAKKDAQLEKERKKEIGKTMIGGTFELLDHTGKTVTDADFKVFLIVSSALFYTKRHSLHPICNVHSLV